MNDLGIPVLRDDDGELLGHIAADTSGWQARTVFGYVFARTTTRPSAEQVVREQGLIVVKGLWQYLDPDDHDWHPCTLTEVAPNRVTLVRTNTMGYQEPASYKRVVLKNPDETNLIPA